MSLLGKNIAHSKSQKMYEKLLHRKIKYNLIDCESEASIPSLSEIFSENEGLSITSPYKKHFLDEVILKDDIQKIGAINCIKKDGEKFFGTNTDYLAIDEIISEKFSLCKDFSKVVILGDGVMSSVLKLVLDKYSISYEVLSRKKTKEFSSLDLTKISKDKTLVVNSCARAYEYKGNVDDSFFFWDLNYSFAPHFNHFKEHSSQYYDGEEMLFLQAKHALRFWKIKL